MRRISKEKIQNLYGPVPDTLFEKADQFFASLPNEKEEKDVKRKISFSMVLAAVLALAGLTAFAIGGSNLFKNMETRLNPILPLNGAQELIQTNLGKSENDYAVVTVEEAVFDGHGVMVLVRIAPKNAETYALYNEMLQDYDEELYVTEDLPVPVPDGSMFVIERGREIEICNENGECVLIVDGEQTDIPTSKETAVQMQLPVYTMDGRAYYAGMFDSVVIGRKDGKQIIDYWVSVIFDDVEMMMNSREALLQADGSVLIWYDGFQNGEMPENLQVTVKSHTAVKGDVQTLDDIAFGMHLCEPDKEIRLIPENAEIGDEFTLLSAEISFTKIRGYFSCEYLSENKERSMMIFLYTAKDGCKDKEITSGNRYIDVAQMKDDTYRLYSEIQSFDEIPDEVIIEVREGFTDSVIGSTVCKTEMK